MRSSTASPVEATIFPNRSVLVATRRQAPVAGASRLSARELAAVGDAEPTLILVDASASPEATYGIFRLLRDTLREVSGGPARRLLKGSRIKAWAPRPG